MIILFLIVHGREVIREGLGDDSTTDSVVQPAAKIWPSAFAWYNHPVARLGDVARPMSSQPSPTPEIDPSCDVHHHKDDGVRCYSIVGSPSYISPEVLNGSGHSTPVDWWALGVIAFEMLTGFLPFPGDTIADVQAHILDGKVEWPKDASRNDECRSSMTIPPNAPTDSVGMAESAQDLIAKLLTVSTDGRLGSRGAYEVRMHCFFESVSWADLLRHNTFYIPQQSTASAHSSSCGSRTSSRRSQSDPRRDPCTRSTYDAYAESSHTVGRRRDVMNFQQHSYSRTITCNDDRDGGTTFQTGIIGCQVEKTDDSFDMQCSGCAPVSTASADSQIASFDDHSYRRAVLAGASERPPSPHTSVCKPEADAPPLNSGDILRARLALLPYPSLVADQF